MVVLPELGLPAKAILILDDSSLANLNCRCQLLVDHIAAILYGNNAASSAAEREILSYDRALRQRSALALRGGCGGALYACALLNAQIQILKGEKQL